MTVGAAPALRAGGGQRSPASRCKRLLLGPPLATSLLVRERLRKAVALACFATGDAFLPRWFTKRGQRLVYSGGILALSAAPVRRAEPAGRRRRHHRPPPAAPALDRAVAAPTHQVAVP